MRMLTVFILAASLHVHAGVSAQTVTYSVKNASIDKVFEEIERQTGYGFMYSSRILAVAKPVTIEAKKTDLKQVLDACFKDQPFTYEINDKTVIVKERVVAPKKEYLGEAVAPPVTVRGRITNENGEPAVGVTISVKGGKAIGSTNNNGEFTITIPDANSVLVFSAVTIETREFALKGKTEIAITVTTKTNELQDVVVSKGYYTVKQRLNTGNVSTVKGEDIQKQPVSDPIQALIGRVPGMNIQQTSGIPGAYAKIQIRGQNSIANGNDPLYIVDGVPFSSISLSSPFVIIGPTGLGNASFNNGSGLSPFNGLNPADIESIEILKDADATALYGSRGANGVVIITTRKGKAGDTHFDLNVYSGEGIVAHKLDMLNTQQYLQMRREAFKNDGLTVPNINANLTDPNYDINGLWDTTRYTDWQKILIGNTAHFTNAQANISGGNAYSQFVIGGGYSKQGSVFLGDFADQKASAHINLTHSSLDHRFNVQFTANYTNDNNNLPNLNMASYITMAPDAPTLYDSKGGINWQIYNGRGTFASNPAANILRTAISVTNNLISNLNLRYTLLPGLELKSGFGYSHDQMNQTQITPAAASSPPNNNLATNRALVLATNDVSSWIIEPQLNYTKILGKGRLEALVGGTFQENKTNAITQGYNGFASDALISNLQAASTISFTAANNTLYRYEGVYCRVGYSWLDRYIINLTGRRDGSSRFGPSKQFGNFGAAGAAWIFSKEKFIHDHVSFLSFGKLRASYGSTGNDQIQDYKYLSTYSSNSTSYQGVNGLAPTGLTNPFFAWELVKKLEAGLELGLLKDRIYISASYYRNRTGNQLVGLVQPWITGFSSIQYNLPAMVQNSGLEFMVNTTNIKSKNFEWTTSISGTLPYNKLVSFPNISNFSSYSSSYVVGQSLFIKKTYHATGVNPQTGLYSFATNNTNGIPSTNIDNYVISKPVTQIFFGGIENRFSFKGFTLDIFIQYVDQYAYNWLSAFGTPLGWSNNNLPTAVLGRWQTSGDLADIQKSSSGIPVFNTNSAEKSSDAGLTDASFIRLKNLALSYQLPNSWKEKLHLQSARIYLQCQNLFTITNYVGLDPETAGTLNVPPLRMVTAGFQVGF